jgi:hypothetical protein
MITPLVLCVHLWFTLLITPFVLSAHLWFTASDHPFNLQLQITPLVLSVHLWLEASDHPFVLCNLFLISIIDEVTYIYIVFSFIVDCKEETSITCGFESNENCMFTSTYTDESFPCTINEVNIFFQLKKNCFFFIIFLLRIECVCVQQIPLTLTLLSGIDRCSFVVLS